MEIMEKVNNLEKNFDTKFAHAIENGDFDSLYLEFFSKTNGKVTSLMKELPSLSAEEKRKVGPELNLIQNKMKERIEQGREEYQKKKLKQADIDMTLPEKAPLTGYLHPTTQLVREMNDFFRYHGYSIVEGPEIETEEYNFRILNLPEGHPATDLQDTLYVNESEGILLRTHTSSIESRLLVSQEPPIRGAFPGKCFRNETVNATNGAFFHQYQGVVVDKGITIQHLFSTLTDFHKFLFGEDVELRFRYKYYPEVSPGVGVDMKCKFCHGEGCTVCKFRGWIEVLGSGMIHYNTLKMAGIDPEEYTGFAFGVGFDRLVMQRFEVDDIRKLYGEGMVYA